MTFTNFGFYLYCQYSYQANNHLFKVNNWNTTKICEIYPELTIKTPKRQQALIQDFVMEGGWLGSSRGVWDGMLPQKIFKIESARLA